MAEPEFNLQELNEKMADLFETYKQELNSQEHNNVNYLLYNLNTASDVLLYKVKYEIDDFLKNRFQHQDLAEVEFYNAVMNKKAECLVKIQTFTSMITCEVMNDYKKKMEERAFRSKK